MYKLSGTGVALVTPLNENLDIDFDGLAKVLHHVIVGGVDYLVVLGTTGESPVFSWDEKLAILDFVIKHANGKPVVMGFGGNNTLQMKEHLKDLDHRNIAALLSASPYYNKPSQEGIIAHYSTLADASRHPILLYNVPHRTSSNLDAKTTLSLAKHPNIIGMKEASGDLHQCSLIARDKPEDFLLISGDDLLTLPLIAIGAEGVISVVSNAYPSVFCKMVNLALKGKWEEARKVHLELMEAFDLSSVEGNPTSIKAAMKALDLCESWVRPPLANASEELIKAFRQLRIK